ncbi:putative uncharacterized transporter YgaY [Grifola frondosa]|uniref:Uncharacterized transporter YgaY n=1 Tax=Grifola frondosa TaxID=5627 RepID=A0A1C7M2C6_GRIFR|nr:putative uncharacterized transporter YgaY [Grifola frondosa]
MERMVSIPESAVDTLPASEQAEDKVSHHNKDLGFLPVPKHLRYDPEHPAHFGLLMNVTFGIASTFLVANLYYCQPLLIQFSKSFDVSYDEVSRIPTLIQGGYAVGLLLITPLGDLVRRRPLILLLTFLSASLSIGLAITKNLAAFEAISFLVGVASVVPQILMPLAADLAPPERRASALSIVLAGLLAGVLIARVLAGIVAQLPAKNKGVTYFGILWSMAKFAVTEPLLVQAVLITIPASACFTNFWVTLTFLLGGPPYFYSTLVPWCATVIAASALFIFQAIQMGAGGVNIAAVIIVCFGIDVFRQTQQVSLTTAVFGLDANARSRLNAVVLLSLFIGQVMGTSVGTQVFVKYGWRPAAALSVAWTGWTILVILARGPHVPRYTWFGYEGGCELRKSRLAERERRREEEAAAAVAADINASGDVEEEDRSGRDHTAEVREKTAQSEEKPEEQMTGRRISVERRNSTEKDISEMV